MLLGPSLASSRLRSRSRFFEVVIAVGKVGGDAASGSGDDGGDAEGVWQGF